MDNEELDKRRDEQEDEKMKGMLEKDSKKANKSKFKMIATRLAAIITAIQTMLPIILGICVIGAILGAFIYILDLEGDNSVSSVAVGTIFEDKEMIDITNEGGNGDYYFKINKEIKDKYIELINKAYYEGYYFDTNPEPSEDANEFVYDKENPYIKEEEIAEWFLTDDYEPYLIKMIRAQIASSYPKLGDYEGEEGTEDKAGNKKDKNGDYVVQGVAKIQRTKMDEEGNPIEPPIELKYVPYDEFKRMLTMTGESALQVLNYFSFDEAGILYYATYQRIKVTVNGEEVSNEIKLFENTVSYKNITAMCSMPYNFLFALLQESENPEYIMKVIDLLMKDTELILMIQDGMNIRTHTKTETSYYAKQTVTYTYTSFGSEETGYSWGGGGHGTVSYTYPAGEPIINETITTTYTNTANEFIKKAKTWCIDFEQQAILSVTDKPGEAVTTMEENSNEGLSGIGYLQVSTIGRPEAPTGPGQTATVTITGISASPILYSTTEKIDEKDFSWNISIVTEKRINYERFLGLWKNEKGEYELDCQFDPNGKKVGYVLPTDNETKSYPVDVIPQENGQRIDELINLLSNDQNLQMQRQLMQYYWNIYMNDNIYDVDVDGILDFIDTDIETIIGGYGGIPVNGCNLTREEFITLVENYKTSQSYQEKFAKYAGTIYDICMSKNINPILCVAVAGQESSFGESVPLNSPFNYWGIGVYNNSSTGTQFASIEDAITSWCDLILNYQTPGTSAYQRIIERSSSFKTVNNKFTGSASNIYDIWCIYAWLGDDHQSIVYGSTTVKQFINTYLKDIECNHGLVDPTTVEERAAYIEYYVDNGIAKIAKEIFGNKAIVGGNSQVAEFALQCVGEGHSRFTSWYGTRGDWCAMFVSYCYDKCGLIPSVIPAKFAGAGQPIIDGNSRYRPRSSGYVPKSGDLIFFKWANSTAKVASHVGIVYKCDGTKVYTVEGNASGEVWSKSHVITEDYYLSSGSIVGYLES